jgi:hypothetical protein
VTRTACRRWSLGLGFVRVWRRLDAVVGDTVGPFETVGGDRAGISANGLRDHRFFEHRPLLSLTVSWIVADEPISPSSSATTVAPTLSMAAR